MNSDFTLAVHALVFLNHKAEVLSSETLAQNICTNPARVRRVMSRLAKAGLVETREGRTEGGYQFSLCPSQVNLRQVSDALGSCFVSTGWRSGDPHMACRVASGMATVMDRLYANLDDLCKDYLSNVTISQIDRILFPKEDTNS